MKGISTGVIREGVTKYLQRNKHVKVFGYAPQNAGGSSATIVTFKELKKYVSFEKESNLSF